MYAVEYTECNPGGFWHLTHANYANLKAAGWEVPPVQPDSPGGLPRTAILHGCTLDEAMEKWAAVVGRDPAERSLSGVRVHHFAEWSEHWGTVTDQTL